MTDFESTKRTTPPSWAVLERQLIDALNQAAPVFIEKYTRPGGSLIWTEEYPGNGVWVDDLYEAFFNWPLFYSLGGNDYVGQKAVDQWNAVTRQIANDYGRIAREFVCNDDWFHSSENYVYFYSIGLSDPTNAEMMRRARRFSGFYMDEDPEALNYEPKHRIIRSPFSGSDGPMFHARWDDVQYNIEHGHVKLSPTFEIPTEWMDHQATREERSNLHSDRGGYWFEDPTRREKVHAMFDKIVMEGDVPVNLGVVGLVAHTYTLTGDDKYRGWIVDYVDAWMERIEKNGGVIPDNVGLNGIIGENRQGQWWGGFYGWAAKSSYQMMFNAMTVAGTCAHLVTGDSSYLGLPRSQFEVLLDNAIEKDGRILVPYQHNEEGWTSHSPMGQQQPIHLWFASQEKHDWELLETIRKGAEDEWRNIDPHDPRSADDRAWTRYLAGDCPSFPEAILQANYQEMMRRLDLITNDTNDLTDLSQTDEHHWLQRNPVVTEALQVLTTGGPQTNYWGGLARGRVRHFDIQRQRPGLPEDVAALVSSIRPDGIDLSLVNLSPYQSHELAVQAGAFGEHRFNSVIERDNTKPIKVQAPHLHVTLKPGTEISLQIGMDLNCNRPTCAFPWHGKAIAFR